MERAPRILAYDALRVLAIVTVVAIHTLIPYRDLLPSTAPPGVLDDALHFAVPLFVFISGVFAWGRPLPAEPGAYRRFLVRRFTVVGVPYLAWSAFYLSLLVVGSRGTLTPLRALGLFLTGHTWYHLYFVPMLLTFYVLTPLATRLGARSPEGLVVAAFAVKILGVPAIADAFRSLSGDLGWSYASHVVTHLPHMALGGWFAIRAVPLPRHRWATVLAAAGAVALTVATPATATALPEPVERFVHPLVLGAAVVAIAVAAHALEPWLRRHVRLVEGSASLAFGVYFVHPLLLLAVEREVASRGSAALWLRPWFPVAVFVGATAGAFALSALVTRLHGRARSEASLPRAGQAARSPIAETISDREADAGI